MKENYLERIAIALETLVSQGNYLSAEVEPVDSRTHLEKMEDIELEGQNKLFMDKFTPEPVAEETKPVLEIVQSRALTHDDLKQACLVKARADSKNRDKLKALLKEYGSVKALDVPIAKLAEVIGRVESGDF